MLRQYNVLLLLGNGRRRSTRRRQSESLRGNTVVTPTTPLPQPRYETTATPPPLPSHRYPTTATPLLHHRYYSSSYCILGGELCRRWFTVVDLTPHRVVLRYEPVKCTPR